jgi:hypothetical protein
MAWWSAMASAAPAVAQSIAGSNTSSGSLPTSVTTSSGAAPASGGGFDWGTALNIGAQVLGPTLGAAVANQGASAQADAMTGANREAIGLQRDIYQDQVARSEPWRQSGLNALNFMNQWNGMPTVSDGGARSMGGGGASSDGSPLLANYGAGQAVQGRTGGGGANGMASAAGTIAGTLLGGPIGGTIGSAIGGMFRDGGDNWTTLATQAPGGFDYAAYMQQPDLAAEWAKPDVKSLFNGNQDAYANWHYNQFGKGEGRTLNPMQDTKTTQPVSGGGQSGTGGQSDLWSTIRNNPLYVAAQDGFLGVNGQGGDVSQIKGAFANNGQLLSGSTLKALQDRSVSRSYGALSDIYGNAAGMAGVGASTASNQNANAGAFGQSAANLTSQNGQIAGQAAATKNANWLAAGQGALSGVYDTAKGKGWI